jgi:hypothetical protein
VNKTYINRDALCELARDLISGSICLAPDQPRDLRITRTCCAIADLLGLDLGSDRITPEMFSVATAIRAAADEVANQECLQ